MENREIVVSVKPRPNRFALRHMYWSAVFAGAVIALMTTFLLTLLFVGVGLQGINLTSTALKSLDRGSEKLYIFMPHFGLANAQDRLLKLIILWFRDSVQGKRTSW